MRSSGFLAVGLLVLSLALVCGDVAVFSADDGTKKERSATGRK